MAAPTDPKIDPLATELLKLLDEFDVRLTRLERSLKAEAGTAQAQKTNIMEQLQKFSGRLASLESSQSSSTSLPPSLVELERQLTAFRTDFASHGTIYNQALESFHAMRGAYETQQAGYLTLQSQVQTLTAALQALPK